VTQLARERCFDVDFSGEFNAPGTTADKPILVRGNVERIKQGQAITSANELLFECKF
jgi:hypothetical protein